MPPSLSTCLLLHPDAPTREYPKDSEDRGAAPKHIVGKLEPRRMVRVDQDKMKNPDLI